MYKKILITKADGTKEAFDELKLENSLLRAGATPKAVDDILEMVREELHDGMTTKKIYEHAFSLLGKHSKPVAAKYSIRRAILELGPTGFPFEDFIGRIFEKKGYSVEIGRTVTGKCVDHEIDVVAYNDKELHFVEAKFHNQLGVKTDVQVALYVKARFDDIRPNTFSFGGKQHKLTQGWLFTNTKFTHMAVRYGECEKLKLVGWNYPHKGNLQDLIAEAKLHPLTCLSSLSRAQEAVFLEKGIVLLHQIHEDNSLLDVLSLSPDKRKEVLDEVNTICTT